MRVPRTCLTILLTVSALVIACTAQSVGTTNFSSKGYLQLPLYFEPSADDSTYRARGSGFEMAFNASGTALILHGEKADRLIALTWHNALKAKLEPEDRLAGVTNYLASSDRSSWRTGISTYERLRYSGIYKNVDLVYYGNHGELEYDLLVGPGADLRQVQQSIHGVDNIRLDGNGDLILQVGNRTLRQHRPVAYQRVGGEKRPVKADFLILSNDTVGFRVGSYDPRLQLVIDPQLLYSSYFGGSATDATQAMTVDRAGNVYLTGFTFSLDFPLKNPIYNTINGQNYVSFVTKFSASGQLAYSTYIGDPTSFSQGNGIAVDSAGEAYVVGNASPTGFPGTIIGPHNQFTEDFAYALKLNSAGNALVYSVLFGGSSASTANAAALDGNGQLYVAGTTVSTDFPVTTGAFQTTEIGNPDSFVVKLNAAGTAFEYATYFGGASNYTVVKGIAIDSTGNAYVGGYLFGDGFPTTTGAFEPAAPAKTLTCEETPESCNPFDHIDATSGFVSKLNPQGTGLLYSTYLAGTQVDEIHAIAVDRAGNASVAGRSTSTNYPVTASAFQPKKVSGDFDSVITRLSPNGSSLVFSTYFGGHGVDSIESITLDSADNVYVAGDTTSTDLPVKSAFQTYAGLSDVFVSVFPSRASTLLFSTYLGGQLNDGPYSIVLDSAGNAYVCGVTGSADFPVKHAFRSQLGGFQDGFITKIGR